MAKVERVLQLVAKLKKRASEAKDVSVIVGYTGEAALFVHENMEMKLKGQPRPSGKGVYWGPHGQSKFLEQPARENGARYGDIAGRALKQGLSMASALTIAGEALQRDSQKLVPREYGNLVGSAFTRLEQS